MQDELPPILVHRATMNVIDGVHRLRAARLRGDDEIPVRFYDGDVADAFVVAVQHNIAHGLPLSLTDRKSAAERIIASHPQWSDRRIASATGIAPGTVAEIRRRTSGTATVRIGQDGRARPVNGVEGRRMAAELIRKDPGLSLRQVARAVGISPETVRDVRNRLKQGDDPVPAPRGERDRTVSLAARRRAPAVRPAAERRTAPSERAAVVERLRGDPALRLSETGRNLLMLLNVHTMKQQDWDEIIKNVPPHRVGIVAQLARDCAELWADVATRMEGRVVGVV
ncbi:helix-turn-helix domain-containing protein [Actinomadura harenae]